MQTILIVDDQETVRRVVKAMVECCGFAVMEASSGVEALRVFALHKERISAVLLDLTMPELSGEATFFSLRRLLADLPVVIMTGVEKKELSGFLKEHDGVGFVHKPFRIPELMQSLTFVLKPGIGVVVGGCKSNFPVEGEIISHQQGGSPH